MCEVFNLDTNDKGKIIHFKDINYKLMIQCYENGYLRDRKRKIYEGTHKWLVNENRSIGG